MPVGTNLCPYVVCSMNGTRNENAPDGGAVTTSVVVRMASPVRGASAALRGQATNTAGFPAGGVSAHGDAAAERETGVRMDIGGSGGPVPEPELHFTLPPGMDITTVTVRSDETADGGT